jgi:hypothetical protein
MSSRLSLTAACLLTTACSEYDLWRDGDVSQGGNNPPVDTSTPDIPYDTGEQNWCADQAADAEEVGMGDTCATGETGGFEPIVEWSAGSQSCKALPVVADLNGDGLPEILVNEVSTIASLSGGTGKLTAYQGDGSGALWSVDARLGYGSPVAVGDVDGDGDPEIVVPRQYESTIDITTGSLTNEGDFTLVLYDHQGNEIWESEHFIGLDFDYATAPIISDMDHDGSPEIVAGRVILNNDGTTRGVGQYGRGSYGITEVWDWVITETTVSAVADLDLDGVEEVIVGNAWYNPDGEAIWHDLGAEDAMVAIANLDDDIEGEMVLVSFNTVRAVDTDGQTIWGPTTVTGANIVSPPAIADLDNDGEVEIVVAGGNTLWTLNADGSLLWSATVQDESGATGASIFDFEGDGQLEVVYIDEIEMIAFDGLTGAQKYYSGEHASATMFDYPVIADVDADGHAEIVVCHDGFTSAVSVYGDADNSWAPTRKVWNQHAYSITNVTDDGEIPQTATPNFRSYNTWHAAPQRDHETDSLIDLEGEILEVCEDECEQGIVYVAARVLNRGFETVDTGVEVSLYAVIDGADVLLETRTTTGPMEPGWSTEAIGFELATSDVANASSLWMVVDDDGTGSGILDECSEMNNGIMWGGPFCD